MPHRPYLMPTLAAAAVMLLPMTGPVAAQEKSDFVEMKHMAMELARDIADGAVQACRERGFQVTAVVVDRSGDTQALLRDVYAPRMTMEIAKEKAGAVILSGTASANLDKSRSAIAAELDHLDEVLTLAGALPIETQGSLVGAVGVSGAPGGDLDAECAQAGLDAVADRLQFGGL
ncbi:MAG: heme-binding protein [Thiohalorhabdus sp.]